MDLGRRLKSASSSNMFTEDEAAAGWNRGAEAYDAFVESGADYYRLHVHGPALLEACEPLGQQRALDLGCGQGFFSRELARRGARVTAVDLSDQLIVRARAHELKELLGIEYVTLSAAAIDTRFQPGSFDVVTACMSLQDMADPGLVLRAAHAVLRSGGRLVFSVPHPATEVPHREWERDAAGRKRCLKLDGYFETGPAVCDWNMPRLRDHWTTPYWRHTLSEWVRLIHSAGFIIRDIREPRPTVEQVAAVPQLQGCRRMPYFLIVGAEKP